MYSLFKATNTRYSRPIWLAERDTILFLNATYFRILIVDGAVILISGLMEDSSITSPKPNLVISGKTPRSDLRVLFELMDVILFNT